MAIAPCTEQEGKRMGPALWRLVRWFWAVADDPTRMRCGQTGTSKSTETFGLGDSISVVSRQTVYMATGVSPAVLFFFFIFVFGVTLYD